MVLSSSLECMSMINREVKGLKLTEASIDRLNTCARPVSFPAVLHYPSQFFWITQASHTSWKNQHPKTKEQKVKIAHNLLLKKDKYHISFKKVILCQLILNNKVAHRPLKGPKMVVLRQMHKRSTGERPGMVQRPVILSRLLQRKSNTWKTEDHPQLKVSFCC